MVKKSMNKLKVLMTASTFPRWEGDTEPRFVLDLAKAMLEEYDVTVLVPAFPGAKRHDAIEGVKVERYHYLPFHNIETLCYPGAIVPRIKEKKIRILQVPFLLLGLWGYLWKHHKEYDLIHAHWLIPQGIVQSCFSDKYVVTGHGGDVTSLNVSIFKTLKKRCLSKAKAVTVVSEKLKKDVLEICPRDNVHIVPMGCDTSMFSPKHRQENYFGQGEQKVVLFVGRLAEKKGVKYLIEAMKRVDALLVVAGGGPCETELRKQALENKVNVLFLGAKTHEELKSIYASADVFAMPSVTAQDGDQEGFGLVMLEAMASGLPVVAFESGGIPQLIKHEVNGLLCEEKDVETLAANLNKALYDEAVRRELIDNGNVTVKEYDYKEVAKRYGAIYSEAMK